MARFEFTDESVVQIYADSDVHPIEGESNEVSGEVTVEVGEDGKILLDPPPTGYVEMHTDALKSGKRLQDMEMRRRIQAKKYPTLRYELKDVTGGPETFQLTGTLTFHGVTQEFAEEATVRVEDGRLHVEGEHTFDIREFDVKPPKILKLQVYPQVRVVARLVAQEATSAGGQWG